MFQTVIDYLIIKSFLFAQIVVKIIIHQSTLPNVNPEIIYNFIIVFDLHIHYVFSIFKTTVFIATVVYDK